MSLSFDVHAEVHFHQQRQPQIPSKIMKKMKDKIVRFNYQRWTQRKMKEIAPHIESWDAEELTLNDNAYPSIVKEIMLIRFPELKQLDLRYNHIYSIEPLCTIEMPKLQKLFIKHNHIVFVKPLRKMYSSSLETLYLCIYADEIENNQIKDMHRLSQMKLKKCRKFQLDGNYIYRIQGSDLRHFAKLEPENIEMTHIIPERVNHEMQILYLTRKYQFLGKGQNRDGQQW